MASGKTWLIASDSALGSIPPPATSTMTDLAAILRTEAESKGISGNILATRAGLAQSNVARILRGSQWPSFPVLLALLCVLGRELSWLERQGIKATVSPKHKVK